MKISFFDAAGTLPYLYSTGDAIAGRQAACSALELKGPPNPNKNEPPLAVMSRPSTTISPPLGDENA
ncbi:hypothetical protein MGN70_011421 [Eutypa lata]|nr:hypothetical protein MGN70_011421 [Eutypa lata]